jgi:hypothetical protein
VARLHALTTDAGVDPQRELKRIGVWRRAAHAILHVRERAEDIELRLENPVGMIERLADADGYDRRDGGECHDKRPIKSAATARIFPPVAARVNWSRVALQ